MGLTRLRLKVKKDAESRKERQLDFLIDSGAVHSVVPRDVLRTLGIKAYKKTSFILANGDAIERDVGTGHFVYKSHQGAAPVVFGEKGDSALLGATTLESLELALNPLTRELYPLQMTMMSDASAWTPAGRETISRRRRARG